MFCKKNKFKNEIELHDKSYVENPIPLIDFKSFKYLIKFKNGELLEGTIDIEKPDELADIFLQNKYSISYDKKHFVYYNSREILYFEAHEKEKGE